jgi:hypothetical protein
MFCVQIKKIPSFCNSDVVLTIPGHDLKDCRKSHCAAALAHGEGEGRPMCRLAMIVPNHS